VFHLDVGPTSDANQSPTLQPSGAMSAPTWQDQWRGNVGLTFPHV